MPGYAAALTAAFCWALGGLIAVTPVIRLGPFGFNRIRNPLSFFMLCSLAFLTSGWAQIDHQYFWYIFFSAIIGIFFGDSALFVTMNRMGPRRTSILFATNAPMTAVISFLVLDEKLSLGQIAGCVVVLLGVLLAIIYGTANQQHRWEQVRGSVLVGVVSGLTAAFCQASGAIIIKPVMESGADPVTVSAMRVGIASVFLIAYGWLRQGRQARNNYSKPTIALVAWIACSGFVAIVLGMTLLLYGLAKGEAGVITTLSATTPVMILPLLWIKTGERPALGSWIGAILTVVGSGILFNY